MEPFQGSSRPAFCLRRTPASRTALAFVVLGWVALTLLASQALARRASAACSDYDHGMRWVSGQSFWHYIPGGPNAQGSLDLVKSGNKVLAAEDLLGLVAFEETAPGRIEYRSLLPMEAHALDLAGERACVTSGEDGLTIVNAADLAHLSIVTTLDVPGADQIDIEGSYAYIGASSELTIVRVSGTPAVVGHLAGEVRDVAVRGNRAYVLSGSGLKVADVSDPANPVYLALTYPSAWLRSLALYGAFLYVTEYSYGLRIFSLANPDLPALVSGVPLPAPETVVVSAEEALVGGPGIRYIDIRDPLIPQLRGTYRGISLRGGAVSQGFLYLAAGFHGVQALALGDGTMPQEVTGLGQSGRGVDLQTVGSVLVLLKSTDLQTIDVSDPADPVQLGSLVLNSGRSMAVSGNHAFLSDAAGFKIVDLTNPSAPHVVGFLPGLVAEELFVSGNRAYLTGWYPPDLWIVDVTDPAGPLVLGHAMLDGYAVDAAAILGDQLFTAFNFEGSAFLEKWDVSDPGDVRWLDEAYFYAAPITDMASLSDRLIVATEKSIEAVDPDVLWSRVFLGDHSFDGEIGLGPAGRLYTANRSGGYSVFSFNGEFHYLGSGATSGDIGYPAGIADVAGYVYVTDRTALHVFGPPCASSGLEEVRSGQDLHGPLRSESVDRGDRVDLCASGEGPGQDLRL